MSALQHVQELDQTADVFLYQLSNYSESSPNETFRFTNFAGVVFDASYVAISCSHTAQEISSVSTQPRLDLTIADTLGTVGALLNSIDGAIEGAKLRVIRTKRKFLQDGALFSTSNGILQQSNLVVTQIQSYVPGEAVVLVCSSVLDFGGGETSCPSRSANQGCSAVYKSVYCGYTGVAKFNLANEPVLTDAEDKCNHALSGCRARNNLINYLGFPTLQRR
jgi:lambda family phage minor tail protein L